MTITTRTTARVSCDFPGGCVNAFDSPTDVGLRQALRNLGWWVSEAPETYCPSHTAVLQAAGKLGPREKE